MRIHVGHSADPDDAFMIWAVGAGKVDTRGLELEPVASDIQTLNEWALDGRLEVTALSAGAYPAVATATSCSRTARRSATATGRSSSRARSSPSTSCGRSRS